MKFVELCEKRYSVRSFDRNRPVPVEDMKYVLEAARLAPSACNKQPWRLFVVTGDRSLDRIKSIYNREWFVTAPAVIIVAVEDSQAWVRPQDSKSHSDVDASIITEHICLAAAEIGLGTCWICNFEIDEVKKVLPELSKDNLRVVSVIPIGYPAEGSSVLSKVRKGIEEIVTFIND